MISCTRRIEFDAAHRVIGHEHKCKYLHGHRYVLEVTAVAPKLNEVGMVVDFCLLKTIIKKWIDENLDHNVILHKDDKLIGEYISNHTGQSIYYLEQNPTAENIALHLLENILPNLFIDNLLKIVKIKLYETPNCYVEVTI